MTTVTEDIQKIRDAKTYEEVRKVVSGLTGDEKNPTNSEWRDVRQAIRIKVAQLDKAQP